MPAVIKAVCTICSREKSKAAGHIPASERYRGGHIARVEKIAKEQNLQFFVLSGFFGFIEADKLIPDYNHPLEPKHVDRLVRLVVGQLGDHFIQELHFYTEGNPGWVFYEKALMLAAQEARVAMVRHLIEREPKPEPASAKSKPAR